MRVKSKYREIKSDIPPVEEIPAENIPQVTLDGEKAEPVIAASAEAEPAAVAAAIDEATKADEASAALKRQLDAIRQNEEFQRQQAAQTNIPTTREGKLSLWRQQGASEAELRFLEANPELIDLPRLTALAAAEAAKQHARGTEAHMHATREIFHEALKQAKAEEADRPAMQTPAFKPFRPPPAAPAPRSAAHFVSAPVSREVRTGGERPDFETDPRRVVLSADEAAIAAASGITAAEYARYKIKMQREKASGQRQ